METRKHVMLLFSIFVVLTFWGRNVAAYDMADYFPLNQRDEWVYVNNFPYDGRFPLKSVINGTELVNGVETIKKDGNCYVMDSEGLKMYKWYLPPPIYFIFDPPKIIFPAQFDVGEIYLDSISAKGYSSDDNTFIGTFTGNNMVMLRSVEDVTVPAGTFKDCLKIYTYMKLLQQQDGHNEVETTEWYARNIGLIKRIEYGCTTTVLISATVDGVQYGYDCPATLALEEDSSDLDILRKFRDSVLSKTPAGQTMIQLYYELSPVMVKAMEENDLFKELVRKIIYRMLPVIKRLIE